MTINTSTTQYIDLEATHQDYFSFPFAVLDDLSNPVDFSSYTSAKMSIRSNEDSSELLCFSSTGATNTIDISGKALGSFVVSTNQLTIDPGQYRYDFEVRNATKRLTVLAGKLTITSDITQ
jgi:hypothetical protein